MKNRRSKHFILYIIFSVAFIGALIFAGLQALIIYIPQSNDSRSFEMLKQDVGLDEIKAEEILNTDLDTKLSDEKTNEKDEGIERLSRLNRDFVGWLSISDTIIDYPVMKSSEKDPEYYLHRDFDKNYSDSGTLFIGEGCNADSEVFVIYGHNMNAGTMFGSLDSYKDANFAFDHKNIVFRTPNGNRVYRVFSCFQTKIYPNGTDAFEYYREVGNLGKMQYNNVLENILDMSLITTNEAPLYPQQIMFLSTCYYHTDEGRFVVAAYRIA